MRAGVETEGGSGFFVAVVDDDPGSAAAIADVGRQLAAREREIDYPLGGDRFRIDHVGQGHGKAEGAPYFRFFRRLGRVRVVVARRIDDGSVLGVLIGVLRSIPCDPTRPERREAAWYLCDLKVLPARDPGGANKPAGVARALIASFVERGRREAPRAYGVSMNPASGPNRVVRLLERSYAGLGRGRELSLFSLGHDEVVRHASILDEALGPRSCLSLAGIKDIVLTSTAEPMRLLHLQHGPLAVPGGPPRPSHVHMVCGPTGGSLVRVLRAAGLAPSATASTVHVGLDALDEADGWSFVLTSDI
jgi:hypothetical protein